MKINCIIIGFAILFCICSCKKNESNPGSDVAKGIQKGYLYNTWIINDEDSDLETKTKNTQTFKYKSEPAITFIKDNSYLFYYRDEKNIKRKESGIWKINDVMQIELTGDPLYFRYIVGGKIITDSAKTIINDYVFTIKNLTEEILILNSVSQKLTKAGGSESATTGVTEAFQYNELLYMEDND